MQLQITSLVKHKMLSNAKTSTVAMDIYDKYLIVRLSLY